MTRTLLPAGDVQAGDWTFFTGYRRVVRAEPVEVTRGRGSKRRTVVEGVKLYRADDTFDRVPAKQPLLVSRD